VTHTDDITQPTYNYPHLAGQARTVQIVAGSTPDKAACTQCMDDDITSGLPDDVTRPQLTLTMGQTDGHSGLLDDIMEQCVTSGLPTDSAMMTMDLVAER